MPVILLFLFITLGSPCSSFFTFSLCRDRNDLFFFVFVVELLERGFASGYSNRQLFSQLLWLKLIDPFPGPFLSVSSSLFEPRTFSSLAGAFLHLYTCTLQLLCSYYTFAVHLYFAVTLSFLYFYCGRTSRENKGKVLCWHMNA